MKNKPGFATRRGVPSNTEQRIATNKPEELHENTPELSTNRKPGNLNDRIVTPSTNITNKQRNRKYNKQISNNNANNNSRENNPCKEQYKTRARRFWIARARQTGGGSRQEDPSAMLTAVETYLSRKADVQRKNKKCAGLKSESELARLLKMSYRTYEEAREEELTLLEELRRRNKDIHYAEECEKRISILKKLIQEIPKIREEDRQAFEEEEHEQAIKTSQAVHDLHKISAKGLYVSDRFTVRDKNESEICDVSLTMATLDDEITTDGKRKKFRIILDVSDDGKIKQIKAREGQIIEGENSMTEEKESTPSTLRKRKAERLIIKAIDQVVQKKETPRKTMKGTTKQRAENMENSPFNEELRQVLSPIENSRQEPNADQRTSTPESGTHDEQTTQRTLRTKGAFTWERRASSVERRNAQKIIAQLDAAS
ncbi:PREDICTED: uncharacterized protein LOC105450627 [Wasmannia auropunctata]|uniref:uncharacterized protein LOC105450627 n=1 Tax=Wasmannia auropunctata TaxID=64793 RepID=UPI0005F05AF5|nr:PREDICTED: uncharacterized protein LOC105450627 [Wasmannia auropunctata]